MTSCSATLPTVPTKPRQYTITLTDDDLAHVDRLAAELVLPGERPDRSSGVRAAIQDSRRVRVEASAESAVATPTAAAMRAAGLTHQEMTAVTRRMRSRPEPFEAIGVRLGMTREGARKAFARGMGKLRNE